MDVIGRHQRKIFLIRECDQPVFDPCLIWQSMALQFHIKAIAKEFREPLKQALRGFRLASGKQPVNWALRSTGEQYEPFGMLRQSLESRVRLVFRRDFDIRAGE